jgi:hypothetical protein
MIGTGILLRHQGQRELEAAIAETDQLDPHWRLEEIEASRGPVPAPEANRFGRIVAFLADTTTASPPTLTKVQNTRDRFGKSAFDKDQVKLLRRDIERAKSQLDLARGLVAIPDGRGDSIIPLTGETYPKTQPVVAFLNFAKGAYADARLRIHDGDNFGAMADSFAVIQIGRALKNEPTLMSQLVRDAINVVACDLIEQLLATRQCSEQNLFEMQQLLQAELASPRVLLGVRTERAILDWIFSHIQSGDISGHKLEEDFRKGLASSQGILERAKADCRRLMLMGNVPAYRAKRLRAANETIVAGQLPYTERFQALQRLSKERKDKPVGMFGWLDTAPELDRVMADYLEEELKVDAALSSAIIAIAVERYRQQHKKWPTTLDDLSPLFLKTLPTDPYTGKPLRMLRKNSALLIYSVGPDMKDDGGALPSGFGERNGRDIGFVLQKSGLSGRPSSESSFRERLKKTLEHFARSVTAGIWP